MVKVLARYGVALAAGLNLVFGQFVAASFDVAVFGSWKAACAMRNFSSLTRDSMRVSQVGFAYAAVHSAWSYEFRREFYRGHQLVLGVNSLIVLRF